MGADADVQVTMEPAESEGRLADMYARHSHGVAEMAYLLTGDRHLEACLKGPNVEAAEQEVRELLASVRFSEP